MKVIRVSKVVWTAFVLLTLCACFAAAQQASGQATESGNQQPGNQHDFDFTVGRWKTHIRRLRNPLTGSTTWTTSEGRIVVQNIWDGRANLEQIEADGLNGHIEGLTLRLLNAKSKQWALYWANANDGELGAPAYGGFENGRGVFYDQEDLDGRAIFVRQIYTTVNKDAYDFEQAFSADGGKTWEPNWIAHVTRDEGANPAPRMENAWKPIQHDFDFNLGSWKTHVSRLKKPLKGSHDWVEYDGTSEVTPLWNGRASLFVLRVKGTEGQIDGLGLRLFDPASGQWSLHWVNGADGVMTTPMVGGFHDGRGEFMDTEPYEGRQVLVRNQFLDIKEQSARFEQAFSNDQGRSWETNWVMTFAR